MLARFRYRALVLSLCSLFVLTACDRRTPEQLTGVRAQPPETPLADISGAPRVEIRSPGDGVTVSPGTIRIEGRTRERGNRLLRTDLWIASERWGEGEIVMSTTQESWSYNWNTEGLYGGNYRIAAVAHDVEGFSTEASITVTLDAPPRPDRPRLAALILDTDSLVAGETTGGTVILEFPAIDDSSSVTIRTQPFHPRNVVLEPQVIPIPQGDSIGSFTVTALPVAHPDRVPIEGVTGLGGDWQVDFLWVLPAGVTMDSLTLAQMLVPSGGTVEATVRLTGPAPQGGAVVELSSSDTAVATVPPTVTVPAGESTATFTVTAGIVQVGTGVNIRGEYGGVLRFDRLVVDRAQPPPPPPGGTLASLSINPNQVVGGESAQGTVTLSAAVGGETQVALSSTNPSVATVPSSVTVPAGQTSANFAIDTSPNTSGQTQFSEIRGQTGDVTRSASISTVGAPASPDNVRITRARARSSPRGIEVRAESDREGAILTVHTGTGELLGNLPSAGGGRYEGFFPIAQGTPIPNEIEVRSNFGGSARERVR